MLGLLPAYIELVRNFEAASQNHVIAHVDLAQNPFLNREARSITHSVFTETLAFGFVEPPVLRRAHAVFPS